MVSLLHSNKCDARLIAVFECHACFAHGAQFILQHIGELALGDAIAEHEDACWLEARRAIELDEQFAHHGCQVGDDLHSANACVAKKKCILYSAPVLLNTHSSAVARWMRVHTADNSSNRRLAAVTRRRVCNVGAEEHHLKEKASFGRKQMQSTGSMNTRGLIVGSRMLLTPPNLTLTLRQRFDSVCGVVLITFFACTHCVATPSTVSPTRFTSAVKYYF